MTQKKKKKKREKMFPKISQRLKNLNHPKER
jgi:hypothetical protein